MLYSELCVLFRGAQHYVFSSESSLPIADFSIKTFPKNNSTRKRTSKTQLIFHLRLQPLKTGTTAYLEPSTSRTPSSTVSTHSRAAEVATLSTLAATRCPSVSPVWMAFPAPPHRLLKVVVTPLANSSTWASMACADVKIRHKPAAGF